MNAAPDCLTVLRTRGSFVLSPAARRKSLTPGQTAKLTQIAAVLRDRGLT